ncbi:hypothetical protein SALBM217S_01479 [Streptomyces griseoloalbus]
MAPGAMSRWTTSLSEARPVSYWLDEPGRPAREPALTGPVTCDLLVVGGGYSGLWTALIAKERDPSRDVVLVEGREVAARRDGRPPRRRASGRPGSPPPASPLFLVTRVPAPPATLVYRDGTKVRTVTGTSATLTGAVPLDGVRLPGGRPQRRGGVGPFGHHVHRDDLDPRLRRRRLRSPGPRPGRLPPRQLRQRLRLHPARRRPRQLGRHRPGLRRADLRHLRRHPLRPLPGSGRAPRRGERRRVQGGDQGQAGGRGRRC